MHVIITITTGTTKLLLFVFFEKKGSQKWLKRDQQHSKTFSFRGLMHFKVNCTNVDVALVSLRGTDSVHRISWIYTLKWY